MKYSEKLKDPRWQKKRLKIFERDEWKCTVCGNETETLHVHHENYKGEPWDAPDETLKTTCESCHLIIEYFKLNFIIEKIKKYPCLDNKGFVYLVKCKDHSSVFFELLNTSTNQITSLRSFNFNTIKSWLSDFNTTENG